MDSHVGGYIQTGGISQYTGGWKNGLNGYRERERNERHDVYMQNKSHAFQTERDATAQQNHVSNMVLGGAVDIYRDNNNAKNTMKQNDRDAHLARVQSGITYGQAKGLQNNAGDIASRQAYQDHNIDMHKNEHNAVLEDKKSKAERRAARAARREGMANIGQLSDNDRVESAQLGADGSLTVKTQRSSGGGATQSSASPASRKPVIGRGGVQSAGPTTERKPSGSSSRAKSPKKAPVGGVGAPGAASRANHA